MKIKDIRDSQIQSVSEVVPDSARFVRTIDSVIAKYSATTMGMCDGEFIMHDGIMFPNNTAIAIVVDAEEDDGDLFTYASLNYPMLEVSGNFREIVEESLMQISADSGSGDLEPREARINIQQACARLLLKHVNDEADLTKYELERMAERLMATSVLSMMENGDFIQVWDDAPKYGYTMALCTVFVEGRVMTAAFPIGASMPDALAKEMFGKTKAA